MDLLYGQGRDIHNRLDKLMLQYQLWDDKNVAYLDTKKIIHDDIISSPFKKLLGEFQGRELKPQAMDATFDNYNLFKNEMINKVKTAMTLTYVQPIQDRITQAILQKYQINEPLDLTPEERQQISQEIEAQRSKELPVDILDNLEANQRSPESKEVQKLTNILMSELKITDKIQDAFEMYLVAGACGVHIDDAHYSTHLDTMDMRQFAWERSQNYEFIHDSRSAVYTKSMTLEDVVLTDTVTLKDLKEILKLSSTISAEGGYRDANKILSDAAAEMWAAGELGPLGDVRMFDGSHPGDHQKLLYSLSNWLPRSIRFNSVQRSVHAWKSLRLIKAVTRVDKKTGLEDIYFTGENYQMNPARGDIKEKTILTQQVFKAKSYDVAASDEFFMTDYGPAKAQYRNIFNPFACALPFVGITWRRYYNDRDPKTQISTPMQLAWNAQHEYNVTKYRQSLAEVTSIGNVLMIPRGMHGDQQSKQQFFMDAKYNRVIEVDMTDETGNLIPAAQYMYRSQNMSNAGELEYYNNKALIIKNRLSEMVGMLGSRAGQTNPYEPARTSDANAQASYTETQDLFTKFDRFINELLNHTVRMERKLIRYNPSKRRYGFDDFTKTMVEIDPIMLFRANPYVFLETSYNEARKTMYAKARLQDILQNIQDLNLSQFFAIAKAETMVEMEIVAERAQRYLERMKQEERASQQELLKMQSDLRRQEKEFNAKLDLIKQERDTYKSIIVAQIGADRWADQYDINDNDRNDANERQTEKLRADMEMLKMQLANQLEIAKIKERGQRSRSNANR